MDSDGPERRREARFPIEAEASIESTAMTDALSATTDNLSGCGVHLHFKGPIQLAVGDEVICEFKVRHGADSPLPCWGLGTVIRVDGSGAAIELSAAGFYPSPSTSDHSADPNRSDAPEPGAS